MMGAKRTRNDGAVASPRSPILILPSVLALLRRHHDTRCRTGNPGYEVGLVHRLTEWRQVRVKADRLWWAMLSARPGKE